MTRMEQRTVRADGIKINLILSAKPVEGLAHPDWLSRLLDLVFAAIRYYTLMALRAATMDENYHLYLVLL